MGFPLGPFALVKRLGDRATDGREPGRRGRTSEVVGDTVPGPAPPPASAPGSGCIWSSGSRSARSASGSRCSVTASPAFCSAQSSATWPTASRARIIPTGVALAAACALLLAADSPLPTVVVIITALSLGYDMTQPPLGGIVTDLPGPRGQATGLNVFALFTSFGLGSRLPGPAHGRVHRRAHCLRRHCIARRRPRRPPLPRRTGALTACGRDRGDCARRRRPLRHRPGSRPCRRRRPPLNVLTDHFNLAKLDNDWPVVTPRSAV